MQVARERAFAAYQTRFSKRLINDRWASLLARMRAGRFNRQGNEEIAAIGSVLLDFTPSADTSDRICGLYMESAQRLR
jgi:hypothetical protein